MLYLYRTFAEEEGDYILRQNRSSTLAIMAKYRQRAIEAKPFIVIINSEDLRKKERHKVQKVMLEAIEANN